MFDDENTVDRPVLETMGYEHTRHLVTTAKRKLLTWLDYSIDFAYRPQIAPRGVRTMPSGHLCYACSELPHDDADMPMAEAVAHAWQVAHVNHARKRVSPRIGHTLVSCKECAKPLFRPSVSPSVIELELRELITALDTRAPTQKEALNAMHYLTWFPEAEVFASPMREGLGDIQHGLAVDLCAAILNSSF